MRKLFPILIMLLCLLTVPATALEITATSTSQVAPHGTNYVLGNDGYIYYNVQTEDDSYCLFRMLADGTGAEKLITAYIMDMCVDEDTLYFFDNTETPMALMRYKVGEEKESITLDFTREIQIVGDTIFCLADDFSLESCITRIEKDLEAVYQDANDVYIPDLKKITQFNEVDRPFTLLWHDEWLYYTGYTDEGGRKFGRIRPDGSENTIIATDADGFDEDAPFIGVEGDTLYMSSNGHYAGGFVAAYSDAEGFRLLENVPQSFAYDEGYFYYSDHSEPSALPGIHRRALDGEEEVVNESALDTPMRVSGDWVFANIGGGLNAEPVMIPKTGGDPTTAPGFGAYDYEANKPVDDTPKIEWNYETYGAGSVELVLRAYEQPAAFPV